MAQGVDGRENLREILHVGRCEPLKAFVHGVLMGSVALCALYNSAAWLRRREHHLAINALIYTTATAWEYLHTQHHLACRLTVEPPNQDLSEAA